MKRLRPPTTPLVTGQMAWPDFEAEKPSTVFSARPPLRKLVVVVDHELLEEPAVRSTASDLLAGLLSHPYIEVFRISDGGPPDGVERRESKLGISYAPGWIAWSKQPSADGDLPFVMATEDGSRVSRRTLIRNAYTLAADDTESSAYEELEESEATNQRVRDIRALEAASDAGADLFITERPYLMDMSWELARQVVVASPEAALPLVSLYLRRQGVFLSYRSADGTATAAFNRGLFYWVGTRDLLPAGWRWFSACVHADQDRDQLIYLGQSLLQRVQRALQGRDAVLWALNQPQDNDVADEALDSLDGVLLNLMAAFDVAARVAHRALDLDSNEYRAGWQSKKWRKEVDEAAPDLAALVTLETPGADIVEIVRLLRNSIHGAALQPLGISSQFEGRDSTLVGLPANDAKQLVAAIERVGSRDEFGLRISLPDRVHADPGKLVDAIFIRAVALLNQLMEKTPVERFSGAVTDKDGAPPENDIFGSRQRESIRLQLGLP